jgi:hypothetical protein
MTQYIRPQRVDYFRDEDDNLTRVKDIDDVVKLELDWSDFLGDDTISSVEYTDNGVTRSSTSNTTTTTTTYVTGVGKTTVAITCASGAVYSRVVRFVESDSTATTSDYD